MNNPGFMNTARPAKVLIKPALNKSIEVLKLPKELEEKVISLGIKDIGTLMCSGKLVEEKLGEELANEINEILMDFGYRFTLSDAETDLIRTRYEADKIEEENSQLAEAIKRKEAMLQELNNLLEKKRNLEERNRELDEQIESVTSQLGARKEETQDGIPKHQL